MNALNVSERKHYPSSQLRLDRHGYLYASSVSSQQASGHHAESQFIQNNEVAQLPEPRICPSPNHDERIDAEQPYLLVIHNISLPPFVFGGPYIEQLFTNCLDVDHHPFFKEIAHLRVSAHFLIRRDGEIVQFVSTDKRAWHAGISRFENREACNNFSIGIELEGSDFEPFTDKQYQALAELSHVLRDHYPLRAVRGHEHIAPVRKTDPGPYFDWNRYRQEAGWNWRQLPRLEK